MIHQFPQGLPDETLSSLCIRYHAYAKYCSLGHTLRELFNHPESFPAPDLPGGLGHLAAELPAPRSNPDWLITNYTLLPFYAPFQTAERVERMKQAMIAGSSSDMYRHIGMVRYARMQPEVLQYCPACREEEERTYGFAYWHRLHQVPGVQVCPTHRMFLNPSQARYRGSIRKQSFKSLTGGAVRAAVIPLDGKNRAHQILLDIAESAAWLLWQCRTSVDMLALQRCYRETLKRRGLLMQGRVDVEELEQAVTEHFSPDILLRLHCQVTAGGAEGWLAELLNFNGYGKHPLEHILLMHFLGIQPQSLLGGSN